MVTKGKQEVAELNTDNYAVMMMKLRQQYDWLAYRSLHVEAKEVRELMSKLTKDYAETKPTTPIKKGKD